MPRRPTYDFNIDRVIPEIEPGDSFMDIFCKVERVFKTMGMKNFFAYESDREKREEFSYLNLPNIWEFALVATDTGFYIDSRISFFLTTILNRGHIVNKFLHEDSDRIGKNYELQIRLEAAQTDYTRLVKTAIGLIECTLKVAIPYERRILTIQAIT